MKKRTFYLLGYTIEIYDFGYKQYMYPSFNGNAEFEVSKKGFKRLYSYIKTINWINKNICKF